MTAEKDDKPRLVLDPIERVSESLFGLIMVLTFTRSLNAAQSGHAEVREMLIGAVGCNLAWGIVDAVMYLMTRWTERARQLIALRAVRAAPDAAAAHRVIADTLHPAVADGMTTEAFEAIRVRLVARPEPPGRPSFSGRDWFGALSVFLWVFLITFPVVIPFLFLSADAARALLWSNGIALFLLFLCGFMFGRHTGGGPVRAGVVMVLLGAVLVAIVMALGG